METYHEGHFQAPKSHRSERPIKLNAEDAKRLAEYLRHTPNASEDDWLFPNCRGTGPVRTHNVLRRIIQPTARELGLPHVTWHLLRHWNATVMHEEGVPLKVAQERLGHARAETTMT